MHYCDADISVLPEECTSNIVSLTSPKDACTACAVSPIFRAAAESNVAWDRFSPSERKVVKVLNGSFFKGFSFMDFGFVGLLTRVLFDFFEKNVGWVWHHGSCTYKDQMEFVWTCFAGILPSGEHVKMLLEHSHPLFHKKYYFNTSKPILLFYQIILQYFIHKML